MSRELTFLNKDIYPEDVKDLTLEDLNLLASEIRQVIIDVVTTNGGHLASSLGAVEIIVALHHVFDSPSDKIVFDVGHQAYAHKILTGRLKGFSALRQSGGIAGFPRREESSFDSFNTGHSSTSISAALGMAVARDLKGEKHKVIAIIGDGALTGGMALEAMNHAGGINNNLLVIFNDNRMSISPNVGAISQYLSLKFTSPEHITLREKVKSILKKIMPQKGTRLIRRFQGAEEALKAFLVSPSSFLAAWGFKYLGPIDGHDLKTLIEALRHIKPLERPVFLHVLTTKGKGYAPAEDNPLKFHGLGKPKGPELLIDPVNPFPSLAEKRQSLILPDKKPEEASAPLVIDKADGKSPNESQAKELFSPKLTYTDVFGSFMVKEAKENPLLVALTAAMSQGTGLGEFFHLYPERAFDVGIAEQHAVTFAAGLAVSGFRPVVAIYSTFLQRSFDQLYHDVALQKLKVFFAVDRAGLVGEDGPTHHGCMDLSYLRLLPGFVVMAPKDEHEQLSMLKLGITLPGPAAIRYPRGPVTGKKPPAQEQIITPGKGELMKDGGDLTIIAIGQSVWPAFEAAEALSKKGIEAAVINLRFVKPLDEELILEYAEKSKRVLTIEENNLIGGLAGAVSQLLVTKRLSLLAFDSMGLPEEPVLHASQKEQRQKLGLTSEGILARALALVSPT
ncbi:MAG: 1-deoxy-D-xylulose-5-phosphate synthase [Deltaproteobacteria bacterium]|jgi:1-deoxy-D-xylulose-5-phosphate synthase|nr:1-deoxy-D-xylulose-5-phosphate synthase [Deltaproteobacteria bacterium]